MRYWKKEPRGGKAKRQPKSEQSKKLAGSKNKPNCPGTGAESKVAQRKKWQYQGTPTG